MGTNIIEARMTITGKQLIGGEWVLGEKGTFQGVDPKTGHRLQPAISIASSEQVEAAVTSASAAAKIFRHTTLSVRAALLRNCADQIMALGNQLLERVSAETGYPAARAESERGRTCNQLRMFADYIETGDFLDARLDTAMPERQPLPRPDLRHLNQAIGPVVVFGASNFPLAFSVAGGDTASALAAGCPVIVKGHPSHAGTSELVAQALARAVAEADLPPGVFSFLIDDAHSVGTQLVQAPAVKAVGFTGSFTGGTALMALANQRPDPIPVFAEMGSSNPVFLLPQALNRNAAAIAQGFVGSFTLGSGQFCVKPGLVIAVDGEPLQAFIAATKKIVEQAAPAVMLNERICQTFQKTLTERGHSSNLEVIARGGEQTGSDGFYSQVTLFATTAREVLEKPELMEETFGPASILIKCRDRAEMLQIARRLPGQLTMTVQCVPEELADFGDLMDHLAESAGRVVVNGFPTGVEVCHSMVHGGPFPATSDQRFTSVGTNAIQRFLRPVCYQNYPEALLPAALRNDNPLGIIRLINGVKTRAPLN
jgi:alpha-ketoglutaric semialdehyde dehydrogenase